MQAMQLEEGEMYVWIVWELYGMVWYGITEILEKRHFGPRVREGGSCRLISAGLVFVTCI